MKHKHLHQSAYFSLLCLAATLQGCTTKNFFFEKADLNKIALATPQAGGPNGSPDPSPPGQPPVVVVPPPVVCDPLAPAPTTGGNAGSGSTSNSGLLARIYAPATTQVPTYSGVMDLESKNTLSPTKVFLNQLNVPTRAFTAGFTLTDGSLLLGADGKPLTTYFALHIESILGLGQQSPGLYQFAILADDGAILKVKDTSAGYRTLINNDGDHATKMGCASEAIPMDATTQIPIQVDWFQGPPQHIALVVMLRKVPDSSAASLDDPACGLAGNSLFFDSTVVPSAPQAAYANLMARGWKVVGPDQFTLPASEMVNPCPATP